jgi:CDP-L-myo-inositol myo-inositolphosphotransferase
MVGRQIPAGATVRFPTARDAGRRVAGISVAGRIVRELAEAGFATAWIEVRDHLPLDTEALKDLHRLAGTMDLRFGEPPGATAVAAMPPDRVVPAEAIPSFLAGHDMGSSIDLTRADAAAQILRRTGKPTDGPVSRWFNRPVSRALSALVLKVPGFRPAHASFGTAILALAMFAALVFGGYWGLMIGAVLFQAASIFDGVDGEVARATFRETSAGASLDSRIDMATTILFIIGLAINLVSAGNRLAFPLAAWSVALIALGLVLVRWRAESTNLEQLKQHYRNRFAGTPKARILAFLTVISSRDFFAFANAAMILVGFPIGPLIGFATSATVWIVFVAGWVQAPSTPAVPAENA